MKKREKSRVRAFPVMALVVALLWAGCESNTDGQWRGRLEIVDGVEQLTNDAPILHAPDATLDIGFNTDLSINGESSNPDQRFKSVYGVTTDADGHIYIADATQARILKFNADGQFMAAIGSQGVGPLQFMVPTDVTVDAQNRLYVLDNQLNRVTVLNADLTLADIWDTPVVKPRRIRIDSEGNALVFAITQNDLVYKFKPDGQPLGAFFNPDVSLRIIGNLDELIAYSDAAMETTPDGYVYFSSRHPYWIRKFDRVAGLERQFTRVTPFEIKPLKLIPGNRQIDPVGLSGALMVLPNKKTLNIIQYQEFELAGMNQMGMPRLKLAKQERWIDLFNPDGKWVMTSKMTVPGFPMHTDRKSKVYFYEGEPVRLVRYTMTFPEGAR